MMKEQWKNYADKFLNITPREQYLIIATGLVMIIFTFFSFAIDGNMVASAKLTQQIRAVSSTNKSTTATIAILEQALTEDPDVAIQKQINGYTNKLSLVDGELLELTSGLINPIQMRYALIDLLKLQRGVALLSFEVIEAQPLVVPSADNKEQTEVSSQGKVVKRGNSQQEQQALTLYKHGIKLKLRGGYFQLRDYLVQLEKLQWKFFWQKFDYQLTEYPNSELVIEMYSLSTNKEFIGV